MPVGIGGGGVGVGGFTKYGILIIKLYSNTIINIYEKIYNLCLYVYVKYITKLNIFLTFGFILYFDFCKRYL